MEWIDGDGSNEQPNEEQMVDWHVVSALSISLALSLSLTISNNIYIIIHL